MIQTNFYGDQYMNSPTENDAVKDAAFGAQYYAPYNNQNQGYYQEPQKPSYGRVGGQAQFNPYYQGGYNYQPQYQQQPMYGYMNSYQQSYNPYGYQQPYGYNYQPQYQQSMYGYGGYQQPPYNPYQQYPNYNPYMQSYNPYGYQQPYGYNYQPQYQQSMYGYTGGQPQPYMNQPESAFGFQYQQNNHPREIVNHIKGTNPIMNNEFMPDDNYEEEIRKLTIQYSMKEIEEDIERRNNVNNLRYGESMFGLGNNYYNMPYYNSGNSGVRAEVSQKIEEMKEKARENKLDFVSKMMRTAYKINGIDISEEELKERYRDKTEVIKDPDIINFYYPTIDPKNERFARLVPCNIDPLQERSNMLAARAIEQKNRCIPEDCTLEEFFDNIGKLRYEYYAEKEESKNRAERANIYNFNEYPSFMKEFAYKRYNGFNNNKISYDVMAKNGYYRGVPDINTVDGDDFENLSSMSVDTSNKNIIINNDPFSTLKQCASLSEDGTLNITFNNFGRDDAIKYTDTERKKFEEDRQRFTSFVDRVDPSYINEIKDRSLREKQRRNSIGG